MSDVPLNVAMERYGHKQISDGSDTDSDQINHQKKKENSHQKSTKSL